MDAAASVLGIKLATRAASPVTLDMVSLLETKFRSTIIVKRRVLLTSPEAAGPRVSQHTGPRFRFGSGQLPIRVVGIG